MTGKGPQTPHHRSLPCCEAACTTLNPVRPALTVGNFLQSPAGQSLFSIRVKGLPRQRGNAVGADSAPEPERLRRFLSPQLVIAQSERAVATSLPYYGFSAALDSIETPGSRPPRAPVRTLTTSDQGQISVATPASADRTAQEAVTSRPSMIASISKSWLSRQHSSACWVCCIPTCSHALGSRRLYSATSP